jgi:hypothetical protein
MIDLCGTQGPEGGIGSIVAHYASCNNDLRILISTMERLLVKAKVISDILA